MRTLIIGCGYLGQRVAAIWRGRGHAVAALTRSTENAATFRSRGIEPIVGDVLEPSGLRSLPEADVVLYAVGYDRRGSVGKREVYVEGLQNVLRALDPHGGRFLYVSSTSVYGQNAGEWVDETSPCVPITEDGRICLAAEEVLRSHFAARETDGALPKRSGESRSGALVLRFAGLYGPGRLLRRIESLRSGEPIRANPEGYLNLIHVDDGAHVVAELAERGRSRETYLVSDNRPIRRLDYYTRLAQLVGAPQPTFDGEAGASGLNKRCSNARLRAELGDVLRFPTYEEGLADALTSGSAIPPP